MEAFVNKQMSLSVSRMPHTLRTVNHAALKRKTLIVWVSKGMLAKVWIPTEALIFTVTGYYIDCLAAVTCEPLLAATPISAPETDAISSARLSVTHSLDYPRPLTGIMTERANILFHRGAVLWWYQNTVAVSSRPVCQLTSGERHVSCEMFKRS